MRRLQMKNGGALGHLGRPLNVMTEAPYDRKMQKAGEYQRGRDSAVALDRMGHAHARGAPKVPIRASIASKSVPAILRPN